VIYFVSILKQPSEKLEQQLKLIHSRAKMTAKVLIIDMIEGKSPISFLIDKNSRIDLETVKKLLYRIQKLFQARTDVVKILNQYLRIDHSKT
jgi:hypothetical protein